MDGMIPYTWDISTAVPNALANNASEAEQLWLELAFRNGMLAHPAEPPPYD